MSEELYKVRLRDNDRPLEVRFVTDCDGWRVLVCEHDVCHLTHEGVDEPVPSKTAAIAMAEVLMRRRLSESDKLPIQFIDKCGVYTVHDR